MVDDSNPSEINDRLAQLRRMALDLEFKPATRRILAERVGVSDEQIDAYLSTLEAARLTTALNAAGYLGLLLPAVRLAWAEGLAFESRR